MNDEIRGAVREYSGWFCTAKYSETLHVRKYNNQCDAACGSPYPKWRYFPVVTLNEGDHTWCDDCLSAVEEHNSSCENSGE